MKTKSVIIALLLAGGLFTLTAGAQEIVYHPNYYLSQKKPHGPLLTIANPWAWPNHILPDKKDRSDVMPGNLEHHPLNPTFKKKPKVKAM